MSPAAMPVAAVLLSSFVHPVLAWRMETECLSVMPGGGQSQASLDASRPLDADAMDRGVAMLTLYQDSVRNDAATYAYARWMSEEGGQVRTAPLLPPRMLIIDRKVAVVRRICF